MAVAEVKQIKESLSDAEVLVVAPRFPSINQPWMDTYLEQLKKNQIGFCIATSLREIGAYQEKVDRLALRKKAFLLRLGPRASFLSVLQSCVRRPRYTWLLIRDTVSGLSGNESLRNRFALALRAIAADDPLHHFGHLRLIHCHSLGVGQHFMPAAKRKRLPLVTTFHGLEPPGVPQIAPHRRIRLFEASQKVIVNTDFARKHVTQLGCPPGKITVLPQGLPLEDFPFRQRPCPAPEQPLELLSVGRFQRDKGQAFSILALRRLRDSGINASWHFVGAGPDKARLLRLAQRLEVESFITFHEGLSSTALLALYHRCHLFVLASRDSRGRVEHVETQGVVLQEAQATGCIPIATRVGGIPECINQQKDGILVPDGSHRAIATAIMDLVASPERWRDLQENGRRNVEEQFSADVIGNRMAELLRQLMQESSPES